MTNQIDEDQFKLVAELLIRQDEALEQLNLLCERVELAIEENIGSRPSDDVEDPAAEVPADQPSSDPDQQNRIAA